MTTADKWEIIVNKYKENLDAQENAIETTWEKIFAELFGYSILMGEIKRQHNVPIGHTNVRIDMLVGNNFIVEVKRHRETATEKDKQQLFGYMKLLGIETGILIGDKIYIYHADNDLEISFTKPSDDGEDFVSFFSKQDFKVVEIKEWVESKTNFAKNVEAIRQENTPELVNNLLRKYFADRFTPKEISQALQILHQEAKMQVTTPKLTLQRTHKRLSKSEAFSIAHTKGLQVPKETSFSNKLQHGKYSVDILFERVTTDGFYLMLSNEKARCLYFFEVEPGAIPTENLLAYEGRYRLYFECIESGFREVKSGAQIATYLAKTVKY
ncbi:MAG: GxxExxY protein [Defluviitaleaceae bacterium]|nr:GxxExxY protein [Defluviitaleaceae bacterium]